MAIPYVHAITVEGPRPEHRTTHVDLHVDEHVYDETRWRVCADPEGNPFCLVPG